MPVEEAGNIIIMVLVSIFHESRPANYQHTHDLNVHELANFVGTM